MSVTETELRSAIDLDFSRYADLPIDPARLAEVFGAPIVEGDPARPEARTQLLTGLKAALGEARAKVREDLEADGKGVRAAQRLSTFFDAMIVALVDFGGLVYPASNPSSAERLTVAAVGGYGRGTLAPGSDIDLLFLFPYKSTAWSESVTEFVLYMLWDLGLKVGHGTRTVTESIRMARQDMTVRTALLEARFLCGEDSLFKDLQERFNKEVVAGTAPEFIASKLAERDSRHARIGTSRYLVEPHVKEGKGGQRDLQTLYWIGKYVYQTHAGGEALVEAGLLSRAENRLFRKCDDFLWAVRCHLHFITGRAEERLSFDLQPELARRLGYTRHPGLKAVERFMKHYFLVAKDVGDLTRIVCAALEERQQKKEARLNRLLRTFKVRRQEAAFLGDFYVENNRLRERDEGVFTRDPVNLIRVFQYAAEGSHAFHPDTVRLITKSLRLIGPDLQKDPEANRLFLSILCSGENTEVVLRQMNETGVLGKFLPEFGRIVAMMQFNMYHHFTVDEHLIRTIGTLATLESGRLSEDLPLCTDFMSEIPDKTVLYVALLLHDIAKGRVEDHSIAGARIARKVGPRLGLTAQQTETVAWLVEQHLTMSMTAQSRDLADRRTIMDFAKVVQTTERLKLLLIVTVCDIRAVGPGVWNGWKGQLLRTLYNETELILTGGHSKIARNERIARARAELSARLSDWPQEERESLLELHYPAYWLRTALEDQVRHAEFIRRTGDGTRPFAHEVTVRDFEAVTEISILTPDHPRLLALMAGACSATGANIVDAQIFTTTDGRALDTIVVSRAFEADADERRRAERVAALIEQALAGHVHLPDMLAKRREGPAKQDAFTIEPDVKIDNSLSDRFTVIEIACLDRIGLLYDLTRVIADLSLDIASAHIATFGERAVDTFYVTDLLGQKITAQARQKRIRRELVAIIEGAAADAAALAAS
ncbi:[protein-PII] uridylyltransferase [Afifella marina]|uniref:Bifunctional uridylyltransferase/uridylyl-removing enzyme n=2 Tax=Hyphomicrobiales TaxID=356 RepID=A0A1G5ND68_AFIMA|nr:[protein-PII] uridylyltransferase [Afifella marina]MBK1623341.1 [protein-PII] uridylyltransferase [Afifella marina DSM 2698]MBK1626335.1 [protein-PII] uridylyltransferase [Afifella marina]MBK5917213.1 [protein-PII] uridylyltransferase [Afifella marina]RAI22184.1 [protein-PII] uridylyltransferase [Afifella marina DSM 2698]SCZ35345.1 UTP--GlnB (protein PII) uridylyltransferase, GlnD [Afifella marina DSM 2698]